MDKYKKLRGKISFIITGDEERDSVNGTPKILEWASKHNYKFDHCLVGEPTSKNDVGDKICDSEDGDNDDNGGGDVRGHEGNDSDYSHDSLNV